MPILFDFECEDCGMIEERLVNTSAVGAQRCVECRGYMRMIITQAPTYQHVGNQDAQHVRDGRIAFDPEDRRPAIREYLDRPSRDTKSAAMQAANIRHLEDGEKPEKKEDPDKRVTRLTDKVMNMRRERRSFKVSSSSGTSVASSEA